MTLAPVAHILKNITCWILLIQMLNISTDPIDRINIKNGRSTHEEDLTVNEIESVYEMVAEGVFDEDIPESDENDEDAFVKIFNLSCPVPAIANILLKPTPLSTLRHTCFYQVREYFNVPEINSPPPKQA